MNESKSILIAGGSGFIGRYLSRYLTDKGFSVSLLVRNTNKLSAYTQYSWDPSHEKIDVEAIHDKDVIINLSGAGIADRFLTKRRKEIIYRSRIDSTALLVRTITEQSYFPSLFINASAIGFYGNRPKELLTENSTPGEGFIAELCIDWENKIAPLRDISIPTAILRIGIVLGKDAGSFSKLVLPLRFGINVLFGQGHHKISWIHIHDLALIVNQLIEGKLQPGIYNAVTPNALSQLAFNSEILKVLRKKAIQLKIPNKVLRLFLGELASVITADLNIQASNLIDQKFAFSFPDIQSTLADLIKN
jgi:uncharacterized protein